MADETPDPFLEAQLERAIAPYRDLLSPERLQAMRDFLEAALVASPVGARLLSAARDGGHVKAPGVESAEPDVETKQKGKRGKRK